MKQVLTAKQMRRCDADMITKIGVPSCVLMERAALCIAECIRKRNPKRVLAACGTGNNGGDGAAAARILTLFGIPCDVLTIGLSSHQSEEMKRQLAIDRKLGIRILGSADFRSYDVILDALFGIGLTREITGACADTVREINGSGAYVVAADIASGISADTGAVLGCAMKADETVTMACRKRGHLLYPGAAYTGTLSVADIGIVVPPVKKGVCILEADDLSLLPKRNPAGNKGTFGKVLVVAGSKNMSGSSYFTCLSALRTGAGMVKLLTVEENRSIIQRKLPEAMLMTYRDEEQAVSLLREGLAWADVIAAGPGIGTGDTAEKLIRTVLEEADLPLILDADGLNVLKGSTALLADYRGLCCITPHMGEMARLTGKTIAALKEDPLKAASVCAKRNGICCILKDARTCISLPDGSAFINTAGNDGMATAGSGDVLTGILAGLLARGTDPFAAGALACLVHGMAGDLAAAKKGKSGMIASDIINALHGVLGDE